MASGHVITKSLPKPTRTPFTDPYICTYLGHSEWNNANAPPPPPPAHCVTLRSLRSESSFASNQRSSKCTITLLNGSTFRITGPLCGVGLFAGHRWIAYTKGRWYGAWYFFWCQPVQTAGPTVERHVNKGVSVAINVPVKQAASPFMTRQKPTSQSISMIFSPGNPTVDTLCPCMYEIQNRCILSQVQYSYMSSGL